MRQSSFRWALPLTIPFLVAAGHPAGATGWGMLVGRDNQDRSLQADSSSPKGL